MTDITARSDVVKLPPGVYQLSTVLMSVSLPHSGRVQPPRAWVRRTREEIKERNRAWHREHYRTLKAEREAMWRAIYELPDDERELLNRATL